MIIINRIKKNKIFLVISSMICALMFFGALNIYIHKNIVSGPLIIQIAGINTTFYNLEATTPLGNRVTFSKTNSAYFDNSHRALSEIRITIQDSSFKNTPIITINDKEIEAQQIDNNTFIISKKNVLNQSLFEQLTHLILFIFELFKIWICLFTSIGIGLLIIYFRTRIKSKLYLIKVFYSKNLTTVHSLVILISLIIIIPFSSINFSDNVFSNSSPDQIDYQNMAVNQSQGYGILISGVISNKINYKTISSDFESKRLNLIKGKRFDRFPGYSILVGMIYSTFGNHPITIKIMQLLFLIIIGITLPLIGKQLWENSGYLSGILSIPLIFFYLIEYTELLLPDMITVLLNTLTLLLYLYFRKNYNLMFAISLGCIAGISILFKPSFMIFFVFMFVDLLIISIKYQKRKIINFAILVCTFLLMWVPYNIYAIKVSYERKIDALNVINEIKSPKNNFISINQFIANYNPFYAKDYVKPEDLDFFNKNFLPNFNKHKFIIFDEPYTIGVQQLILIWYSAHHSHIFFMMRYHHSGGFLDLNNEHITDSQPTNKWASDQKSFYNNDNISQSEFARVLNFYKHHPEKFIEISYQKLTSYFSKNFIITPLCIMILLYMMLIVVFRMIKQRKFLFMELMLIISFLCLMTILGFNIIDKSLFLAPLVIIFAIFTKKKIEMGSPFAFLVLTLYLFPLITFGNPRYMIYYDFILFPFFGVIIIETLNVLRNFVSVYSKS